MALQVWLPLNGNLDNNGLSPVTVTNNGATVNDAGKIGKCYSFSSNYIQLGAIDIGDDFSVCYWVKYNSLAYPKTHVGIQHSAGAYTGNNKGWDIGHGPSGGGAVQFDINDGNGHKQRFGLYETNPTQTGVWKHYVIACSLSERKVRLYVNGVLQHTVTIQSTIESFKTNRITNIGGLYGWSLDGYLNDFRIYDHCLSPKEVKEIAKGLVLHYKLDDPYVESTINLGNTSATYSNKTDGSTITASSWGGTTGTITFHHSGGYNNYPYKVYHRTACGTGGFYNKTANDIVIEAGKTYTVSCYMKCSQNVSNFSQYSFTINRGSDNYYINCGRTFSLTTEWQRMSYTFTANSNDAGSYGEMSIVYGNTSTTDDIDVYYCGFQIEAKDHATPYTPSARSGQLVYDCSGYGYDGTINGTLTLSDDSPRYGKSSVFNGTDSYVTTSFPAYNVDNTFVLWVKFNNITNPVHVLDCRTNSPETGYQPMYILPQSGYIQMGGSATGFPGIYVNPFVANTWYHIAVVTNSEKGVVYVNGVSAGENTNGKGYNYNCNLPVHIGCRLNGNNKLNGDISDFRIYATALSADDIKELYNTSALIHNDGTIEAFEFVEGSSNMFKLEDINKYPTAAVAFTNRNGDQAIPLPASWFWYGNVDDSLVFKNMFLPNTQYKFDFWIDSDDIVYQGNNVPGGIIIYYTDGSRDADSLVVSGNSTNPKGWQHRTCISDASKSIKGLTVYYYISTPAYYRYDSIIIPISTTTDIGKNGVVETGQFREGTSIAQICKGDHIDTNQIIES